jgi:NAD(P)H-nitrite reductase large subunit
MSESIPEILEKQLKHHLGEAFPTHAAYDIHAALELSEMLEARGFSFQLKDLCPKSPNETQWRAVFIKDGQKFSADDPQSSIAVCTAAVDALTNP